MMMPGNIAGHHRGRGRMAIVPAISLGGLISRTGGSRYDGWARLIIERRLTTLFPSAPAPVTTLDFVAPNTARYIDERACTATGTTMAATP